MRAPRTQRAASPPLLMCALSTWTICAAGRASAQYTVVDLYTLRVPAGTVAPSLKVGGAAGGQTIGNVSDPTYVYNRAFAWNAAGAPTPLTPTTFAWADVFATSGSQQVGDGDPTGAGYQHALLWNGSANSFVDLNPPGMLTSSAQGLSGSQQVGQAASLSAGYHAVLWNGTANSTVDLTPTDLSGLVSSLASGTDGIHQVGEGIVRFFPTIIAHALLWSGSGNTAIDLHPGGYDSSHASAVRGNQQVGQGEIYDSMGGHTEHALLWRGSSSSVVDLTPSWSSNSAALDTNGTQQVGAAASGLFSPAHAIVWTGSANSAFDLQSLLPTSFTKSVAYSIDSAGNIYGVAYDQSDNVHAIEWVVPEPSLVSFLRGRPLTPRIPSHSRWASVRLENFRPTAGSSCDQVKAGRRNIIDQRR